MSYQRKASQTGEPQLGKATNAKTLSEDELRLVAGGKRTVDKIDVDGDGKWDIKVVIRT